MLAGMEKIAVCTVPDGTSGLSFYTWAKERNLIVKDFPNAGFTLVDAKDKDRC